jgi:hypothetical protein
VTWPPTAADFYLELDGRERPLFQGDIFEGIPFVKAKGASVPGRDPTTVVERRTVAASLHSCDMCTDDGYTLRKPQAIVLVREEKGDGMPQDWDGCYHLCPLPDLKGDGKLWVADFSLVANIDRGFLTADHRIRCLSELGWAVWRQRATLESSRAKVELERMTETGAATWAESMMEMDWLTAGRFQASFHGWLDEADQENCEGFECRRDVLKEPGGINRLSALLRRELGGDLADAEPVR